MKSLSMLVIAGFCAIFIAGCAVNEEAAIQAFCENSPYIGEGALQIHNQDTNDPQEMVSPFVLNADTFPTDVKWVRNIITPVTRVYTIVISGDSADVTITSYFHGEIDATDASDYGFFVDNDFGLLQRTITDSAVQKIKLYNGSAGWQISKLTAANIYTVGINNPIAITEVKAQVPSRNYTFTLNSANTYFTKNQLPTFLPEDTVTVTITLDVTSDSAWAFLHHGAGHKPAFGLRHHYRDPFYRTTTNTFQRSWVISADSLTYGVRFTAFDMIAWQTLFGDTSAAYYARSWALPYIVKEADQTIPPDTLEE